MVNSSDKVKSRKNKAHVGGGVYTTLAIIAFSLVFLVSFDGSTIVAPAPLVSHSQPHAFDFPDESITEIHLTAVYFVPKDVFSAPVDQWHRLLEKELTRLQQFHAVQFRGRSIINFVIHPSVIRGVLPREAYDVDILQHDDPAVLRPIAGEVAQALQLEFNAGFPYHVLLVLFEGRGAGGSKHLSLIARDFFERADTREYAGTFLAHEFYHALGIPDAYATASKVYTENISVDVELIHSRDIMGRVRIPLEETYIAPATITAMGL